MEKKLFDNQGREIKVFNIDSQIEGYEVKEVERPDGRFGIIKGFLATYGNIDRVDDRIEKGAFDDSLKRHRDLGRPVRMLFQHNRMEPLGKFPIELIQDTEKGLFVTGELNLEVQRARETYALVKDGTLSDMSIGFSIEDEEIKDGIRILKKLELWEGSIVDEPANPEAVITEVKSDPKVEKVELKDVEHVSTLRDLEQHLRDAGNHSKKAAKHLAQFAYRQGLRDAGVEIKKANLEKILTKIKETNHV